VDTNGVKLSGLSTDDVTSSTSIEQNCLFRICNAKKRNSIHVGFASMFSSPKKNRYSKKPHDEDDNIHDDPNNDVLLFPGHIQPVDGKKEENDKVIEIEEDSNQNVLTIKDKLSDSN